MNCRVIINDIRCNIINPTISKCDKGCRFCIHFDINSVVKSHSTGREYNAIIPQGWDTTISCNSSNIIYIITCSKCYLQYVGETVNSLSTRFYTHRSSFMHPDQSQNCKILSEHFHSPLCRGSGYTVQVLEVLAGTGRDMNGNMDPSVTKIRKGKEKNWMLKLRTVYPYGLNDMIGDEYRHNVTSPIGIFFPSLPREDKTHVRKRFASKIGKPLDTFLCDFDHILRNNLPSAMNFCRIYISSLKRSHLRSLGDIINDYLARQSGKFPFLPWYEACLDIICTKIYKAPPKVVKKKPANILSIFFHNKGLDFVNISKIINDPVVIAKLPLGFNKIYNPTVVYKLSNGIRHKIFNYKEFLSDLDIDSFLVDNSVLPCSCENSCYKDHHHGHVITGDLRIVKDNKLRKLLSKGPKYRETTTLNFGKCKEVIVNGIRECVSKLSAKYAIEITIFDDWVQTISHLVDNKIELLENRIEIVEHNSLFENFTSKKCLEELQHHYIMVPIDKASNNIAFICKRYYAITILKELGFYNTPNPTYEPIILPLPDLITQQIKALEDNFHIKTSDNFKNIPSIYCLPKMHKTPIKFRFIISSKYCASKQLSKYVAAVFSHLLQQIERYHNKSYFFSGIKSFWIIQNNKPLLDSITKINKRKSARNISNFDFSTLYTMLPHDKLIDILIKLIEFYFKGHTQDKVIVNLQGNACWKQDGSGSVYSFTKTSLISAVQFLIHNCFFSCGNKIFRQEIGIPMGGDPAPHWANLFLFYYESEFIKKVKQSNSTRARKFRHIYRYIDDLQAINDYGEFEKSISEIYPPELILNKENDTNTSTSFLDLSLKVKDGDIETSMFDKRDKFPFAIVRLPYLISNIPKKMFYSAIGAEFLRICRVSSDINHAKGCLSSLFGRAIKQGADRDFLLLTVGRTINRHEEDFQKFHGSLNVNYLNSLFT